MHLGYNGSVNIAIRSLILQLFAVGLAGNLYAQTFTDIGPAAPSPETNDIYQLSTQGNQTWPDGLNYFTDNNPSVGPTFTTGTNAMNLVSVAIKTAGLSSGNGYGTPASTPTYYLRIYSMSGTTATLLITFSAANPGFTDGDWLQWSGLNVPLATNKTYAFSFGIKPSGGGYAALAVATNTYAGGDIAIIPIYPPPCHCRIQPMGGTWEIRWKPSGAIRIRLRPRSILPPMPGSTPFASRARGTPMPPPTPPPTPPTTQSIPLTWRGSSRRLTSLSPRACMSSSTITGTAAGWIATFRPL
jgi:hypothetical protein